MAKGDELLKGIDPETRTEIIVHAMLGKIVQPIIEHPVFTATEGKADKVKKITEILCRNPEESLNLIVQGTSDLDNPVLYPIPEYQMEGRRVVDAGTLQFIQQPGNLVFLSEKPDGEVSPNPHNPTYSFRLKTYRLGVQNGSLGQAVRYYDTLVEECRKHNINPDDVIAKGLPSRYPSYPPEPSRAFSQALAYMKGLTRAQYEIKYARSYYDTNKNDVVSTAIGRARVRYGFDGTARVYINPGMTLQTPVEAKSQAELSGVDSLLLVRFLNSVSNRIE